MFEEQRARQKLSATLIGTAGAAGDDAWRWSDSALLGIAPSRTPALQTVVPRHRCATADGANPDGTVEASVEALKAQTFIDLDGSKIPLRCVAIEILILASDEQLTAALAYSIRTLPDSLRAEFAGLRDAFRAAPPRPARTS